MSTCNRSLILEEIREPKEHLVDLLPMRRLSTGNSSTTQQPVNQVVRVSGTITISF